MELSALQCMSCLWSVTGIAYFGVCSELFMVRKGEKVCFVVYDELSVLCVILCKIACFVVCSELFMVCACVCVNGKNYCDSVTCCHSEIKL